MRTLATATAMAALFAAALGAGLEIGRRAQHPSAAPAEVHASRDVWPRGRPPAPGTNATSPGGSLLAPARSGVEGKPRRASRPPASQPRDALPAPDGRAPRPAGPSAAPASFANAEPPAGTRIPGPRRPKPDKRPPVPAPPAPSPAAGVPAGASGPAPPAPRATPGGPAPGAPSPDAAPAAPSEISIPVVPSGAPPAGPPAPEPVPRFFAQAGSFDAQQEAAALARRLQSRGYAVTVETGPPYRVRVGGYVDEPTAERLAGILRTQGFPATVVRQ